MNLSDELGNLISTISYEYRDALEIIVSHQEIMDAIFQLGALKALGPNVMSAMFYQKSWDIVGRDVVAAIMHFFDNGYLLKDWISA